MIFAPMNDDRSCYISRTTLAISSTVSLHEFWDNIISAFTIINPVGRNINTNNGELNFPFALKILSDFTNILNRP